MKSTQRQRTEHAIVAMTDRQRARIAAGRKERRPSDWATPGDDAARRRVVRNRIEDLMAAREIGVDVREIT